MLEAFDATGTAWFSSDNIEQQVREAAEELELLDTPNGNIFSAILNMNVAMFTFLSIGGRVAFIDPKEEGDE